MTKLHRWTARAAFGGFIAFAVLFASVYPGSRSAGSPLTAATAPSLGSAQGFAVLGGSTVTNTGATTVTGDLGVSPGTAVTGFPPGTVNGTTHAGDAVALQAQSDVTTAYNNLAGQTLDVDLTGTDLGGLTLTPGVYRFSSSAQLTGLLTLNAQGNADAVWVFQIGSTLTTATNSSVLVINSGQNCNVFWQVGSSATLGTTTTFVGNILALTSITLNTGASVSGRALARNGAVTMDTNTVSASVCAAATPTPTVTLLPATATPTATPLPATATAIAATATAIALTPTATPLPATATPAPAPISGDCLGWVNLTKRLEDQNGNDLGVAENLPQLELVLGANHSKPEVMGLGKVRFSGLGVGEWEIWENGRPTGKTTHVACDTATETVLFNRIQIDVTATPAPEAAAATPVPATAAATTTAIAATATAIAASTPTLTPLPATATAVAGTADAIAAATPTATAPPPTTVTAVPATPATPAAATPVPSAPLPTATPSTPTAASPVRLPFTGDPLSIGLVSLALMGGAGAALVGLALRRVR